MITQVELPPSLRFILMESQIEKKLDRILTEYSKKILLKEGEIKILLIDFTREYNKIWDTLNHSKKSEVDNG